MSNSPLPDFTNPPVNEVVLGIQFEPLPGLDVPHMGLFWNRLRDRFPETEQHPPLAPAIERFGATAGRAAELTFDYPGAATASPRCWFMDPTGSRLIQLQADRFILNWRKTEAAPDYPRYPSLRESFNQEMEAFSRFVADENLGDLIPTQCEVTYVNHLVSGEGWTNHGDIGEVTSLVGSRNGTFLPSAEDFRFRSHYPMGDESQPLGRLYIRVDPVVRVSDETPMFVMNLTARGAPLGAGADGVLEFLDRGREWVVRGFADITTPKMHELWGRNDAG